MSGPVSTTDAPPAVADCGHPSAPCVEVTDSRDEQVGQIRVRRALPRKGRRTVGAWCFADHMGPADVTENSGLDVGPHPHIGLQTVTWLIDGRVLHRDSLGSEQVIKPGQLNRMTSGGAVSHAEEATGHYRGTLEGIQLWVALPEATRHGGAAFEHHAQLPQSELDGGVATVLVGATRFPSGRRVGPNAATGGRSSSEVCRLRPLRARVDPRPRLLVAPAAGGRVAAPTHHGHAVGVAARRRLHVEPVDVREAPQPGPLHRETAQRLVGAG
jgi:hypothetical protein